MKPDFATMTRKDLKAYVLSHRNDQDAIHYLMSHRSSDQDTTWYEFDLSPHEIQAVLEKKIKPEKDG